MSKRTRDDEGSPASVPIEAQREEELDQAVSRIMAKKRLTSEWVKTREFTEETLRYLMCRVRSVILSEPMLVPVAAPVNICGDVHGQLHDLQQLLAVGPPPVGRFLFLGDYVDRGKFGVECIAVLLYYKLRHKDNMYLLRGNHETETLGRQYGFFNECKSRYSPRLFKAFTDLFNVLPVAALIEERALCMHGGLSQELTSLDDIRNLRRPYPVPDSGLVCDLLWADPEEGISGWGESERGVSHTFGADVVDSMTASFDLDLIVRAHQVMDHGYGFFAGRRLVTVFSASNYCGEFTNWGAMLQMDEDLRCRFVLLKPDYCGPAPIVAVP